MSNNNDLTANNREPIKDKKYYEKDEEIYVVIECPDYDELFVGIDAMLAAQKELYPQAINRVFKDLLTTVIYVHDKGCYHGHFYGENFFVYYDRSYQPSPEEKEREKQLNDVKKIFETKIDTYQMDDDKELDELEQEEEKAKDFKLMIHGFGETDIKYIDEKQKHDEHFLSLLHHPEVQMRESFKPYSKSD